MLCPTVIYIESSSKKEEDSGFQEFCCTLEPSKPFSLSDAIPKPPGERCVDDLWGTSGVIGDSIVVRNIGKRVIYCNTEKTPPVRWGMRVSCKYSVNVRVYYIDQYHKRYGCMCREWESGDLYTMNQPNQDEYGNSENDFSHFKTRWFSKFVLPNT